MFAQNIKNKNLVNAFQTVLWNRLTIIDYNVKIFLVFTISNDFLLWVRIATTKQCSADRFLFTVIIYTVKISVDLEKVSVLHMECLDFKSCKRLKKRLLASH